MTHFLALLTLATNPALSPTPSLNADSSRMIICGVPPYEQVKYKNKFDNIVYEGCGPVAGLMLCAYYDRRFGYKSLIPTSDESNTGTPDGLIQKFRDKMNTTVVTKEKYGITLPNFFNSGLKDYVKDHYDADVDSKGTSGLFLGLDGVFDKSVELIKAGKPHVILFDWNSQGKVFPTHYSVVVGYDKSGGKQDLVINPGWGYSFQILDCKDKKVKPVRLYWLDMQDPADGPMEGHKIGPSGGYSFTVVNAQKRLEPTLYKHFSSTTVKWRAADSTEFTGASSDTTISRWN